MYTFVPRDLANVHPHTLKSSMQSIYATNLSYLSDGGPSTPLAGAPLLPLTRTFLRTPPNRPNMANKAGTLGEMLCGRRALGPPFNHCVAHAVTITSHAWRSFLPGHATSGYLRKMTAL